MANVVVLFLNLPIFLPSPDGYNEMSGAIWNEYDSASHLVRIGGLHEVTPY
ncbi:MULTISPECIES: hypothetical protein [unclassified Streptomyces]|uniref:hypothetical protein n=1 Tax=unclassified Streptomyces TaxID=2593676 RepID=UPI003418564F